MNLSRNIALTIWILFSLIILIFMDPHRTVSINYWLAAHHWLTQGSLYHNGVGFIYLPQSAIIYSLLHYFFFSLERKNLANYFDRDIYWGFFRYLDLCTELLNVQKYAQSLFCG